ncbi:hypothetical protein [uncultured Flavobacterium sp.]|uniref:hypothetical protein n=1 Tax=uncultured Flavobacterium sp. TaxID=165435 RepID=UPI0025D54F68|nr:hypothetical protein [uncultured Flavobacterium sp.]
MKDLQDIPNIRAVLPESLVSKGNGYLGFCVFAYGFYALLMMMESIDFAEMLHSKPVGYSATYGPEHVMFLIIDFVICSILALLLLIMKNAQKRSAGAVIRMIVAITLLRSFLIYYLYEYTDSESHFVPYIYKQANVFSNFYRFLFAFLQVLSGILCTWVWFRIGRKSKIELAENKKTP